MNKENNLEILQTPKVLNNQCWRQGMTVEQRQMKTGIVYTHTFPNRQKRRYEKQTIASKNRKDTNGRNTQMVDITVKGSFGQNIPTGWVRKIVHHPVLIKIYKHLALPVWRTKKEN
jgi:hypothetical protein